MKFLIVANGPLMPATLLLKLANKRHIVALDGACDALAALKLRPDIILGDLDSIANKKVWGIKEHQITDGLLEYAGTQATKIVYWPDQNRTDLQKGIDYCDRLNASDIILACAISSTRLDHSLMNLRVLRAAHKPERSLMLYTETQIARYVCNQSVTITGKLGDYCGILAFPKANFTSEGLLYDGQNYALEFGVTESVANQLAAPKAIIDIRGEALVIQPI